jgi:hypothetical protein
MALIRELRQLVEALDRRVPHIERAGEITIARESAELRARAVPADRRARTGSLEAGVAHHAPQFAVEEGSSRCSSLSVSFSG